MNDLTVFKNKQFGEVRAVEISGEPWFVGKDVATCLAYSNSRKALTDHVDSEDKGVTKCDTLGGKQEKDYSPISGNRSDGLPGKPRTEHILTLDMAKELCMIQRTPAKCENGLAF